MDNFAEQLVEKRRTGADLAKKILISAAALLVASFLMYIAMLGFFVMVILAVLVLAGGVWLLGSFNVEYEYILTNNDLDIDKIIGKRKRKRMISLDLSTAEAFAPYPPETDVAADATVHAYTGSETDAYYLVVNHSGYGRVKLIFNPNEKMRTAITQELPALLRNRIAHNLNK